MAKTNILITILLIVTLGSNVWADEEPEYLAIFMQGKKVGHSIHTRRVEGNRVTTKGNTHISIRRLGATVNVTMAHSCVETVDGKPLSFESEQTLGFIATKVRGTIDETGQVEVITTSGGREKKTTMQWPKGALMEEGVRLLAMEKGLEPGSEYTVKLFDVEMLRAVDATIKIGDKTDVDLLGRVVKLTEMTTEITVPMAGRTVMTSYVDEDSTPLKTVTSIMGINMEFVACPKEFALSDNDVLDMIDRMFIDSPVSLRNPGSIPAITYWLTPNDGADFVIPTTDTQKPKTMEDGTIELVIRPVAIPEDAAFPYSGDDPELLEALKPNRFLQSDDERIIELARQAVGDAKDAGEAVKRIEAFVAGYIDNKSLSVGYASAAEVASSRQGDCSEFAVLTAALCRVVGIPAQVVVGIAYVRDFGGHEGFGGHAWNQAYVGGKWVGLDAAFKSGGRGGYDPGHIALAVGNGEPADFFNMATALGQFKIETMTIEDAK